MNRCSDLSAKNTPQANQGATAALFDLNNVALDYQGIPVLHRVTLRIRRGEKVALIGKSGAGKSTLLKHLRQQQSNSTAWCPQHPGLVPMLSVFHNIYMGSLQRHNAAYNLLNLIKPLAKPLEEVSHIAACLGLEKQLLTSADRLSGGQQQRTAIGRALYQRKPLLLADEPVAALDDIQGEQLLNRLCTHHDTAVLALHDLGQALQFCRRIIGLKDGEIVIDAPTAGLCVTDLDHLYR